MARQSQYVLCIVRCELAVTAKMLFCLSFKRVLDSEKVKTVAPAQPTLRNQASAAAARGSCSARRPRPAAHSLHNAYTDLDCRITKNRSFSLHHYYYLCMFLGGKQTLKLLTRLQIICQQCFFGLKKYSCIFLTAFSLNNIS